MGLIAPVVRQQAFQLGISAPFARLHAWLSGSSTPQAVYLDVGLTVPATNPIVADASGRFPAFWLADVAYRLELRDSTGVTIWGPEDNISTQFDTGVPSTPTVPGGSTTQVQYNNAGAFAGDAGLTYDAGADRLTSGALTTGAITASSLNASGAIAAAGTLTASTVTLTGGQIAFPATAVPSINLNTLDDFEEGTWTPTLGGSSGTSGQTYADRRGTYVKVGKTVWCAGEAAISAKGTISGYLQIQGLPFTSEIVGIGQSAIAFADFDGTATTLTWIGGFIEAGTTNVQIRYKEADASTSMGDADTTLLQSVVACGFMLMYRAGL